MHPSKSSTIAPMNHQSDKYKNVIEYMKLGVMEVDLDGIIQYANDAFCTMVEYELKEILGQSASKLFLAEGSINEALVKEHSEMRRSGKHSVYEIQIIKKSGLRIWVLISGGPLYNEKGEIVGTIGIHHDFTEKHRSDESLKHLVRELAVRNKEYKQKQRYLKAINNFSGLIADKDSIDEVAGVITDNIISQFGFTDCVVYILDEEDQELIQTSAFGSKRAAKGGVNNPIKIPFGQGIVGAVARSREAEIIFDTSKDERYILDAQMGLSEIAVPIIYDDQVLGVIDSEHPEKGYYNHEHLDTLTTIANIAASKLKSAIAWEKEKAIRYELEESELKVRNVINSALDAFIMIDADGLVTEWNEKAEEIFEYTAEETLGERLSELIIPQQYQAAHEKGMNNFFETGNGPVLNNRIEITAIGKERPEFPIELSISPIKIDDVYFFSAFARDISQQKADQQKIEKTIERERELNELKFKFISMASHEFRTPLTTIKVNADLLSHRLESTEGTNQNVYKSIKRIDNEVERLKRLMNDVLTIGRLESGKIEVNLQKTSLVYLVNKVIGESFRNTKDGRNAAVSVYGKEQDVFVDPPIFEHIITNLISNAFKYSEGCDEPEVNLDFNKKRAKLTVKDHGIGIPKDDLENIFNTFFRASNVGNIQGSGVGLSIVNQFVQLHHGSMDLQSEEGKGTTVSIMIPYESN